jgi:predicted nucleic acid-binding Zn ribbon protein
MKYVRAKTGEITIEEDGAGIPADAETIFSTDPSVYEGTWETEKIHERGDIIKTDQGKTDVVPGGSIKSKVEEKLDAHEGGKKDGKPFWTEPHKPHPTDRVCLNCGKKMVGVRPNKKFCSENCRKRYSEKIKRTEKRAIRDFKPHRGPEGQIFYMYEGKVAFIPALWAGKQSKAIKFVTDNIPEDKQALVIEQIKEVI